MNYNFENNHGSACAVGRCFDIGVNSSSGVRVLNVGGNYNSNANYGFFYFNANNDASNANSNIGSRLNSLKNSNLLHRLSHAPWQK